MAALTEIRLIRRRRAPRLIVIDAASGAGKSSFLRAGLWPRLKRDSDFAPLAILRPSQGILTGPDGLGRRIAPFFERHRQPRAAGAIYAPLMGEDEARAANAFAVLMSQAVTLATDARRAGNPEAPAPAPLIAIDQAEEMFAAEHAAESQRFLAMLAAFLAAPPWGIDPYVVVTIRADSVQQLLDAVAALGLETPKAIYLPPLSPAAYREVILRPAEVYSARVKRLTIDPVLADALVRDATGADALPLLAFTLARLFGDFAADGRLTHEGYVAMGGIAGSIRRALAEARAKAGAANTEVHLRRLLVPALVTWDTEADAGMGAAKRLAAQEAALLAGPRAELAPLVQALVDVRLMRRDRETLEVAHEALLRLAPISEWLEEDREFLVWCDRTARARAGYEANARGLLVGRELDIARGWLEARSDATEIAEVDRTFILASAAADERRRSEDAERERAFQSAQLEAARAREQATELELLRARQGEADAKVREAEAKAREETAQEKEVAAQERAAAARRVAQRTLAGLLVASALAVATSVAGWLAYVKQGEAERNAAMAEEQRKQAVMQSQKAREAVAVIRILFSQTRIDVEKARSREDRDKEIHARLQREAAKGNVAAMRYVGLLALSGQGVVKNEVQARNWIEKAAAAGDAGAMLSIGALYVNSQGAPPDYAKAREWFEKAAAAGEAAAITNIGLLNMHGWGVPRDYAKARERFENAAAAGEPAAMRLIGGLYANGQGVPQDYTKAREWYEKAVAVGETAAMQDVGTLYFDGRGVPKDAAKGLEWYEKAATAGVTGTIRDIAQRYADGDGVPQNFAKAREWYEKAAAAGEKSALTEIGQLYLNGQGVPRDYAKAREWYEKAATAGDTVAMRNIALLYVRGDGVQQDYAKARQWYEKAVAAGDTDAMMGVAALHFTGRGVPQDHSRAHQWLEKAAAAGNAAAMSAIGDNYAGGQGVPQDYAKARDWYEKAAATRDARAMIKLAEHYSKGQGVPQDYAKAREWLEKAVAVRDAGADGDLAFIALFARDFAQALNAATRALAAQPDSLWIATNRAHALMFLGRAEEAREVYLIHKNKRIPQNENKTWQQVIAEDFAELRKAGLDHPQMLEIEAALGILKK